MGSEGRRNQCVECGGKHDNRNLICDGCAPTYGAGGSPTNPRPDHHEAPRGERRGDGCAQTI